MAAVIYSYVGMVYFFIFLILWLIGFYQIIRGGSYGIRLRNYVHKKYPDIRISYFVFIHKKDRDKLFYFPEGPIFLLKLLFRFGSRKATEEWLSVFMDIKELRKVNDKKIDIYLEKLIKSTSWFVRIFVIGAISFLINWHILMPLESHFFDLPPQP